MTASRPGTRERSPLLWVVTLVVPAAAVALVVLVALASSGAPQVHQRPVPEPTASGAPPVRFQVFPREQRVAAPPDRVPLVTGTGARGLGELRGKVVVLNFWASWCAPCATEQPELTAAHRQLEGPQVAFLGVAVRDAERNARAYWEQAGAPYDSLLDPTTTYAARFEGVGPAALPLTLVIDRSGRVAARIFGATTAPEITSTVRAMLAEPPG